jgi:HK97 family phage major capsid protein
MEETREKIQREVFHRTVTFDRAAVNAETRTAELSFSSEAPVERWYGKEILDHSPESVRMGRMMDGAPLLLQHEAGDQIGVIESARIDGDKRGRAIVRFSRSARGEEMLQDVVDGIRSKVSVGYMVHKAQLAEKSGDVETYRIMDWEPFEVSLVSIPADATVGVGRAAEQKPDPTVSGQNKNIDGRGISMEETKNTPSPEDVLKAERERVNEIRAYGKRFVGRVDKIDEITEKAEREGWDIARMKGVVADRVADGKPIETPATDLGLSKKETEEFSLRNLILSQIPGSKVRAGFEMECSNAVAERLGTQPKGFYIPYDVQSRGKDHPDFQQYFRKRATRDLVTSSPASAGYLVADNLQAGSFIDLLRNKMISREAGVRQLSGLVGDVLIPRQLTSATAVWCTEGTGINSESTQTFDQVSLQPNEVGAYTEISRKLLQQATPGIDGLVQSDLATVLALARDKAIFHGTGGTQPTGIAATSSIGTFTGASIDWTEIVAAWQDIQTANADAGSMAWVGDPTAIAVLMTREKGTAGYPTYLMNDNFTMLMYRVLFSNQITAGYLFFGDYSQVIEGEWGVLDMLVNPYILDKEGLIRITAYQSVDVAVRQPGAFTVASGVS